MNVHSLSNPLTKPILPPEFLLRAQPEMTGMGSSEFQARRGPAPTPIRQSALLAPLRRIRDFVRLCRQRRRQPLWLLDKLQDRQDCA
jgi:hypothetical protein